MPIFSFLLDQLKLKVKLQSSSPLLRTLYMNPDDAKLSDVNGTPSNSSASQPSFVNDDGGRYMLSRGPLPSSIPGRYGSHNTAIDWTKTELRHRELKAKLQAIDHEIEKKKEDIKVKMKNGVSYELGLNPSYSFPSISTKAGASVSGSGFHWHDTLQRTSSRSDFEWPKPQFQDQHSIKRWGELTKGCNLPQKSLHLRSEPIAAKRKQTEVKS